MTYLKSSTLYFVHLSEFSIRLGRFQRKEVGSLATYSLYLVHDFVHTDDMVTLASCTCWQYAASQLNVFEFRGSEDTALKTKGWGDLLWQDDGTRTCIGRLT